MKVRATTSFSVEPSAQPASRDALRSAVARILESRKKDDHLIAETSFASAGNRDGDSLVELVIDFDSDSYGQVDTVMLQLTDDITTTLESTPDSPRMERRETQIIPG